MECKTGSDRPVRPVGMTKNCSGLEPVESAGWVTGSTGSIFFKKMKIEASSVTIAVPPPCKATAAGHPLPFKSACVFCFKRKKKNLSLLLMLKLCDDRRRRRHGKGRYWCWSFVTIEEEDTVRERLWRWWSISDEACWEMGN